MTKQVDITGLLAACQQREEGADSKLYQAVYDDVRRLAGSQLRRLNQAKQTFGATDLSHELYLKLAGQRPDWQDRAHFFAAVAQAMRHILINRVKGQRARKRGGDWLQVTFDSIERGAIDGVDSCPDILLTVHTALEKLEAISARLSQMVQMRFFAGMTEAEIGRVLAVDPRTVRRDWRKAKALLTVLADE